MTWTSDSIPNFVIVVLRITPTQLVGSGGIPQLQALIRGMKVDDSRNSPTNAYSSNPVACLGHFLTTYAKPGTLIDQTTFENAADRADGIGSGNTLGDGSKRRIWSMVVGQRFRPMEEVLRLLENAAGVFAVLEDDVWYFMEDGPVSTAHTVDEDRIIEGTSSVQSISARDKPDEVRVMWYDADADQNKPAEASGSASGRLQTLRAAFITRYREARRFAIERYNRLRNENLIVQFDVHGQALDWRRGEVISISDHSIGLSNFLARITMIQAILPGRWRITAREYLTSTYSNSITSDPFTGVGQPDDRPLAPPTLTGLAGTATAIGRLAQIDLSWTDPNYDWFDQVVVDVYDNTNSPTVLLNQYFTNSATNISMAGLPADVDFYVEARVISSAGVNGTSASATVAKPVLPTPPAVSDAEIDMVKPIVLGGGSDGIELRARWTDIDFRAWFQYRIDVWTDESTSDLSDSELSDRTPDFSFILPQGGEGLFQLPAAEADSDVYGDLEVYRFRMYALNAAGTESEPYDIQSYGQQTTTQTDYHYFGQTEDLSPLGTPTCEYTDEGDDGDGNHTIAFSFVGHPTGILAGVWVNVYNCNSGGVISSLLKRIFLSAGRINLQVAGSVTYQDGLSYGLHAIDGSVLSQLPDRTAGNNHVITTVRDTPGARYYRFGMQFAGAGDQLTDEYDCTNTSGGATVLGPL